MTVPAIGASVPQGPDGAPLLVLGCSLGTSSLLWDESAAELRKDFRVSVWELPGHGSAPAAVADFSVGELADAVAATYEEDFVYAGVSLGGAVGLELAMRHADRVTAVVTVCAGARFVTPDHWRARAETVRASGTGALIVPSAQRWFAPGTMERSPHITGRLLHALRDADDDSYARCCDALAQFDARQRLRTARTPIVAAYGTLDPVTPQDSSQEIADAAPRSSMVAIVDASHLATVDKPYETATVVREALRGPEIKESAHD